MKQINEMNEMVQAMMSMSNERSIKIDQFSGKQKGYPEWELKHINTCLWLTWDMFLKKAL
jgi:hypothetical protein